MLYRGNSRGIAIGTAGGVIMTWYVIGSRCVFNCVRVGVDSSGGAESHAMKFKSTLNSRSKALSVVDCIYKIL